MVLNARILLVASTIYLLIPNIIFLGTWVAPHISITLGIILLGSSLPTIRNFVNSAKIEQDVAKIPALGGFIAIIILGLWVSVSGIGGAGFQNSDYIASNSMLHDLMTKETPLVYPHPLKKGEDYYLVYYVGYYLPGGLLGKYTDWLTANVFTWIWSYSGILLSFGWFCFFLSSQLKTSVHVILGSLFFALASGLDFIGYIVTSEAGFVLGNHIEWWAQIAQISSQTSLLCWVPQHAIPAWIATAIVYYHTVYKTPTILLALPCASLPLWSPFAAVGLFPFLLYTIIKKIRQGSFKDLISTENLIVAPTIAAISLSFLIANSFSFPLSLNTNYPGFYTKYSLIIVLELLPFIIIAGLAVSKKTASKDERIVFMIASITLIGLPLLKMGYYNDIVMRGNIPSLFIIYTLTYAGLLSIKNKDIVAIAIVIYLIGAITSISELWRNVQHWSWMPPNKESVIPFTKHPIKETVDQREGNPNSFFFKILSPIKPQNSQTK